MFFIISPSILGIKNWIRHGSCWYWSYEDTTWQCGNWNLIRSLFIHHNPEQHDNASNLYAKICFSSYLHQFLELKIELGMAHVGIDHMKILLGNVETEFQSEVCFFTITIKNIIMLLICMVKYVFHHISINFRN